MATTVLDPTAMFSEIWQLAIKEYEKEVGINAIQLPLITTGSGTIEEIVIEIEQSQSQFETYRKKGEKLRGVLKPIIKNVKTLAVLGDGVSVVFPLSKAIFTALKVLVEASKGVSETYDAIIEIFESLNLFLGRLSIYVQHELIPSLKEVTVNILVQTFLTLGRVTNMIKEKRSVTFMKQLIGKNSKVQEALSELDKLMAQEGQSVAIAIFSATNQVLQLLQGQVFQIKENLKGNVELKWAVDDMVTTILREAETQHEEIKAHVTMAIFGKKTMKKREQIVEWLRSQSTDDCSIYARTIDKHEAGTGAWFLDHPDYKSWAEGDVKYLECYGMAGAGKSVLAAIAYHTLKHGQEQATIPLLHIHLQYNSVKQQSMSFLFCSLLFQLVQFAPDISTSMLQLYSTYQGSSPPLTEIMNAVRKETLRYRKVLIMIDALDELSATQDGTEDAFVQHLQSVGPTAHIMITSRNRVPFSLHISSEIRSIKIQAHADDIQKYIRSCISRGPLSKFMTVSLQKELLQTITEKSKGMFLVARLQMESLTTTLNVQSLRQALHKLPPGLKGAYSITVERIRAKGEEAFVLAMQVFKWLVFSKTQLSLLEIQHALAAEGQFSNWLELEETITPVENIISVCTGLVMDDEVLTNRLEHWKYHSSIRFIHASAYEYFEDYFITLGPAPQRQITEACLNYISQVMTSSGLQDQTRKHQIRPIYDIGVPNLHRLYPLVAYALLHWGDHAHAIQEDFNHDLLHNLAQSEKILRWLAREHHHYFNLDLTQDYKLHSMVSFPLLLIFFDLSGILGSRIDLESLVDKRFDYQRTYLTYAAGWGRLSCTAWILGGKSPDTISAESDKDLQNSLITYINTRDSTGRTAISYASGNNQIGTMRLLLMHKADFTLMDDQGLTPFAHAIRRGHKEAVKLLLEFQRDFNTEEYHSLLLYAAAAYDSPEVIRLLLDRGLDIHGKDEEGKTAIFYAAQSGYTSTVRFLLEHGADWKLKDSLGCTPLFYAAGAYNNDQATSLLIEETDVNLVNFNGNTALHYAATRGNINAVKLLLDHGANLKLEDSKGRTVLSYAAVAQHAGSEKIMKLLLQDIVDVNLVDSNGCTSIFYAAAGGNTDTVILLLEHGAEFKLKDSEGRTPLSYAAGAYRNSEEVVKLLIQDIDVNLIDSNRMSAIYYAARGGNSDTIRFLIEQGADAKLKDSEGRTPISYAVKISGTSEEAMKLLIRDIDVNLIDSNGRTLLSHAAEGGNVNAAKFLLGHKADFKLNDNKARTPLSYAAGAFNGKDVVELLIHDIDINLVDLDGRTAISYAAENGHTDVIKLLLEHGADCHAKDANDRCNVSYAAASHRDESVHLLIEYGADVDLVDASGRSAISYAAQANCTSMVEYLLDQGVDPHLISADGRTLLSFAAGSSDGHQTMSLFTKMGMSVNLIDSRHRGPISYAAEFSKGTRPVKILLKSGAVFDQPDSRGRTPLSYAAGSINQYVYPHGLQFDEFEDVSLVKLLLDQGALVDSLSDSGRTPLSFATEAWRPKTAELLIKEGANPHHLDNEGHNPLWHALSNDGLREEWSKSDCNETLSILRQAGAK